MQIKEYYFESVDSTNNEAKKWILRGCPEGTVISAGRQTAGRGRRGHVWQSPQDEVVASTIVLYPKLPPERLSMVTLVAAMAVRKTIQELFGLEGQIKWPNDLVLKNRKICGILTEMSVKDQAAEYVIVGIGINVHNRSFPPELSDKAISLDQLLEGKQGRKTDCSQIRKTLWENFLIYYNAFLDSGDLSRLQEEYNRYLINRGRQVRILDPLGDWEGTAKGINSAGELLVDTPSGLRRVDSGEVSVRGADGYV